MDEKKVHMLFTNDKTKSRWGRSYSINQIRGGLHELDARTELGRYDTVTIR